MINNKPNIYFNLPQVSKRDARESNSVLIQIPGLLLLQIPPFFYCRLDKFYASRVY